MSKADLILRRCVVITGAQVQKEDKDGILGDR